MQPRQLYFFLLLTSMVMLDLGCGSPEVAAQESLKWIFRPLEGAVGVSLEVEPTIYFSDEVNGSSVTSGSVFLESAVLEWNQENLAWECQGDLNPQAWGEVAGNPAVAAQNPSAVVFSPVGLLEKQKCYRHTFTTAVRGKTQGYLEKMPCPKGTVWCRPDVGAEQTFWTVTE